MLKENKIISVLTIEDYSIASDLAKCLFDSGIRNLEITLRTEQSKKAIEQILKTDLDLNIGVGTVLNKEDLYFSKNSGCNFALSPCTDIELIKEAINLKYDFCPGVSNPSEINSCIKLGCKTLKMFPAVQLGGINYFKSIYSAFITSNTSFIALGGIDNTNAKQFIENEYFSGVGASWIAEKKLIRSRDWKEINRRAKILLSL